MKVAIFDFCDTIVNFQTADRFVYYVLENVTYKKFKMRKTVLQCIQKCDFIKRLDRLTNGKYSLNKRIILWQLRGLSKEEMEKWAKNFYEFQIVPNLYLEILDLISEYKKKGYMIYLLSGGYDIYLKFFVCDFMLDGFSGTKLKFSNNIFSGKFDGMDCMRENKVKMLNEFFPERPGDSVVYSDSKSDLPMLLWADKSIVVSKKGCRQWVKQYGLEEYILNGELFGEKTDIVEGKV